MSMRPLFAVYSRDNQFEAHEKSVRVMYFIPREAASNIAVQKGFAFNLDQSSLARRLAILRFRKGFAFHRQHFVGFISRVKR